MNLEHYLQFLETEDDSQVLEQNGVINNNPVLFYHGTLSEFVDGFSDYSQATSTPVSFLGEQHGDYYFSHSKDMPMIRFVDRQDFVFAPHSRMMHRDVSEHAINGEYHTSLAYVTLRGQSSFDLVDIARASALVARYAMSQDVQFRLPGGDVNYVPA